MRKYRVFYLHAAGEHFDCEATSSLHAQEQAVAHWQGKLKRRKVKGYDMSVVLSDVPVSTVL